jgi:Tol biopolymer transport system component
MGEVYRATDSRLGRTVALKLLPDAFAADPERLARFEREARLLAALNHPRIAHLYGFETATRHDGTAVHFIAMELVEGEGLSDRMAKGPIPLEEALPIARQIAEALEEAHEKGIVHRDLKPANVKLTPDGDVKVLDFGLAKAWIGEGATASADLSQSPTLVDTGTAIGVVLGTAAYMSPEQARGRAVDKKTDIWAFGIVVWEMLTGRRLFAGETVSDVIAAILTRDVDWGALPPSTPSELRRLLRECLDRNPKNRLHDIADARIALMEIERGGRDAGGDAAAAQSPARRLPRALAWTGLAALAVAAGLVAARLGRPAPAPLPSFRRLTNDSGIIYSARFAPDGANVVYGEASAGSPVTLFSTPADASAPRRFDWPSADVVGIASNGQMALILGRHYAGSWLRIGTLAQASLAGGAPRALLERVYDADISRDGASFAVVRDDGHGQRLEFPIGKVLYRATGWISSPRISADGRRIAFADHPLRGDDQGFVAIVDGDGKSRRISGVLNFLHGVAWAPGGGGVYATFGDIDRGTTLEAFAPSGSARVLFNNVGLMGLHDVAPSGRLLVTAESMQVATQGHLATGSGGDYFATWFGESFAGISQDGRVFAGSSGSLVGGSEYRVFYRLSDGSAPVFLGDGFALGISPDGRWVFAVTTSRDRSVLRAEPTGPGETRRFDLGKVEMVASSSDRVTSSSDGTRIAFLGVEGGSPPRGYVFDLEAKRPPRAVTPPNVGHVILSPRGDALVALDDAGAMQLYPIDGSAPRAVPGAAVGEVPLAWASSGEAIFVWDRTLPARIQRVELTTCRRELALEWTPRDPAATLYGLLTITTDARWYLMRYRRGVSSLATVDGVR